MIRDFVVIAGIAAVLSACSPSTRPDPPGGNVSGTGINISGTAVAGVAGGSGQSAQMVSGIKDLEMSVGVALGGN